MGFLQATQVEALLCMPHGALQLQLRMICSFGSRDCYQQTALDGWASIFLRAVCAMMRHS
jgi:hypothetical protein